MALSATFLADFTSFDDAVQRAEVELKSFESGAGKVETSLTRVSQSLSGTRIIQQATIAARAVEEIGGISKLTERELARLGFQAEEALAKMQRMGITVPPGIQKIADAAREAGDRARDATPKVSGLHGAFQQFDSILASMGVRIGPQIKGLAELGDAAGKTTSQVGAVATAGLVAGAAFAGWKIGRQVAEFFDLDEAIGGVTARLLGLGDVSAETAGAQADAIARASARIGFQVESMSTALLINRDTQRAWQSNTALSAQAVAAWQAELDKVRAAGDLASLTKDLASQNFELTDLAARYGVSVDALQFMAREQAKAAEIEKAQITVIREHNAAILERLKIEQEAAAVAERMATRQAEVLTRLWNDYNAFRVSAGGTANESALAQIDAWAAKVEADMAKAGGATETFHRDVVRMSGEMKGAVGIDWQFIGANSIETLQEIAKNARATYDEMIWGSQHFTREVLDEQLAKTWAAEDAARTMGRSFVTAFDSAALEAERLQDELDEVARKAAAANRAMGNTLTYNLSTPEGMAYFKQMNPGATVNASMEYFLTHTLQQAILAGLVNFYAAWGGGQAPGFASGVEHFSGGPAIVGERGPELLRLPAGSSVYPLGSGGAGGASMTVNVHPGAVVLQYPIMRDRQAMDQIGDVVGQAIVQRLLDQGWRPPLAVRH